MRIGLTTKLLFMLGITSLVTVLAMALAARWNFQHGFLDYLGQQELTRIAPLREALLPIYARNGSWAYFERDPAAWPRFVDDTLQPQGVHPPGPRQGPRPPGAPEESLEGLPGGPHEQDTTAAYEASPPRHPPGPRLGPPPAPPAPMELLGLRVRLLDARGQLVAGVSSTASEPFRLPIELDGAVIGWLLLSPPEWFEDDLAQRFNSQHNRTLVWISVGVLALAFVLGWVFGQGLLRRIRTLARGARQLAGGDFGTRIVDHAHDELSALSEDFNRLAAALERNEALRRRGMADVSHELRTPVAVARAELDALIDGIRPCNKTNLEQVQGRLLTLGRLLDDLYDLALSDAGALAYRFSPLDLGEIVRLAVVQMEDAFARQGIALHLECTDTLPMDGDRGRLRQVLDNLLGNSLRYTDSGGVTRVVAKRAGAWIEVSVQDTAPGVAPEALERLFDRFYRVEASRSRAKGGAGLGLAICRNIIEAHRGSILARAADAGGLAIDIRLPTSDGSLRRQDPKPHDSLMIPSRRHLNQCVE
ncbi:ATP-binding protein [Thiocapsa marina]|uniref:histidine kinase n=1 Tax=Thiocapsa marina 5811 TaxID=768671 RepID=F9U5F3_9GAMM|nr:ATP-binding protein [Thiocapsa marina]EGV20376.1 integral membrane sensor signal transduction histidine kinase [Thiocapsa marina 5811]